MDGVKAVAEVTDASVENVRLADRGETVIGEVMGDVAYQAYYAEGRFKEKPQKIYAMFMMYPNLYQVVVLKNSGIESIYDVKGKDVSLKRWAFPTTPSTCIGFPSWKTATRSATKPSMWGSGAWRRALLPSWILQRPTISG